MAVTKDANGRYVTTYNDGSYIDGVGVVHNPDGSVVPPSAISTANAVNAAGAAALHQGSLPDGKGGFVTYGATPNQNTNYGDISYKQSDGTTRPLTPTESNTISSDDPGNQGGPGDAIRDISHHPVQVVEEAWKQSPQGQVTTDAVKDAASGVGDILGALKGAAGGDSGAGAGGDAGPDAQAIRDNNQKLSDAIANQKPTAVPDEAATTVAPAAQSSAASLAPASTATTATSGQTSIDPAATATASQASQAAPATASTYGGATINTAASDQSRTQQEQLADAITGAMNGTAPSVAQEQLKKAGDQAVAQQYALAASARGQNVGLGLRQAQQGAASIGAQNAQDAAILRAQEIATARGQLGDVLAGIRGQDVSLASNQGGLTNAAGIASAANLTNTSQFNTGETNKTNQFNAGAETDVAKANAAAENARAAALAQLIQNNNQFNAGQTNSTSQFNATATNKQAEDAATLAQNNSQFNATQTNTAAALQAQLDQKRASDELTAVMQGKQLDITTMNDLITAINGGSLGLLDSDTKLKVEQMDADAKKQAALYAAIAGAAGSASTLLK